MKWLSSLDGHVRPLDEIKGTSYFSLASVYASPIAVFEPYIVRISDDTFDNIGTRAKADEVIASNFTLGISLALANMALALIAVLEDDIDLAITQHETLLPFKSTLISTTCPIVADRLLGLLAHTMGKLDNAQAHFEDTRASCREAGYRPELA